MIVGLLITFVASGLVSLSMNRHYRQVFPNDSLSDQKKYSLRACGYVGWVSGLAACVIANGVGLGVVWFTAFLNVSVFGVAMMFAVRGRPSRRST
ncbi:MAG: DUF3325 domain-containing protein [Pseudomonadota bacterium]